MATFNLPVLGFATNLDDGVYPSRIRDQVTLTNADVGKELCYVLPAAATITADTGLQGKFRVPDNYVSTPVLVIRGILNGAPSTLVLSFGVKLKAVADDETYDAAFGTENVASASSVSQANEDVYEETITIADTLSVGDDVDFWFYLNYATPAHTYTGTFLLTGLYFRYNDS